MIQTDVLSSFAPQENNSHCEKCSYCKEKNQCTDTQTHETSDSSQVCIHLVSYSLGVRLCHLCVCMCVCVFRR